MEYSSGKLEGRIDVFHAGPLGEDLKYFHKGW